MQYEVCRRADSEANLQGVFYGIFINVVPRPPSLTRQTDDYSARRNRLLPFLRGKWRGRRRHRQAQPQRFNDTAHRVCRSQHRTAALRGHRAPFDLFQLRPGDLRLEVLSRILAQRWHGELLSLVAAVLHGAALYKDRGDVDTKRSHQHAGNYLVAAAEEYRPVETVRLQHYLY